jgi:hypothetical protein
MQSHFYVIGKGGGELLPLPMKLLMHLAQVGIGDVGVHLGGGDGGVAEECLYRAQVGAVFEKVGRKGVAEHVWGDGFGDAGFCSVCFDESLDRAGGEAGGYGSWCR